MQAFEMRCYQRLLCILYKKHVTNEEVRRMIQVAIGESDKLLTHIGQKTEYKVVWSRLKVFWFTILHGIVKGKRRGGRLNKRWEDNIKK